LGLGHSSGQGDFVVAAAIVDPGSTLLVAGANGIGKRTPFDDEDGPVTASNPAAAKA
jgi:hypothetical protein